MRRKLWRVGLLTAVGAVGCNRQAVQPGGGQTPPMFGASANSKFDPTTIPQQQPAPAVAQRKPNAPLRADTEVALADNAVQDAYQEQLAAPRIGAQKPTDQDDARELQPKYTKAEQDRLLDTARQRYQRALATEPAHKGALLGLARLYAGGGDTDRAVLTLQTAAKAHPQDLELVVKLAKAQVAAGTFPAAEQTARHAVALDRESRDALTTLGVAVAHQGKWQEAGEALLAAKMPEADAHYFLARVRTDRGDFEGARKQVQLALTANPQHPAAVQLAARFDAGRPAVPAADPVMAAGYSEGQR